MNKEKIYTLSQCFDGSGQCMLQCAERITDEEGNVFTQQPKAFQFTLRTALKLGKEPKVEIKESKDKDDNVTKIEKRIPSRGESYDNLLLQLNTVLPDSEDEHGIKQAIIATWNKILETAPYPDDVKEA